MIFELSCGFKNYEWGSSDKNSLVGQLSQSESSASEDYFAEYWMGIHPSCPSFIKESELSLSKLIEEDPLFYLGKTVNATWGTLPFLFKVLSIDKPLSIQTHPTKKLAETLHAFSPDKYGDDNHKPEMALALTPVSMLYGFSKVEDISARLQCFLHTEEELQILWDRISLRLRENQFKEAFQIFFKLENSKKQSIIDSIVAKLLKQETKTLHEELFCYSAETYPEDKNVFILFFMDILELNSGEAIYIEPLILHAYLKGNLAECMANSDNTIRAGMTPKFKDFETIFNFVSFETTKLKKIVPKLQEGIKIYTTPSTEFEMLTIELKQDQKITFSNESAAIIVSINGEGKINDLPYQQGSTYFISAQDSIIINPTSSSHFVLSRVPF